jgi:hypothetical protein
MDSLVEMMAAGSPVTADLTGVERGDSLLWYLGRIRYL